MLWESKGVTISDLNDEGESINYRNLLTCYLGVGFITIIYSVGMVSMGLIGFEIPAVVVRIMKQNM